jgi:co-chaperonin GroES (HSP10)
LKPLGNRVLIIEDHYGEKQLDSGLVLPEQRSEKPLTGIVVEIGDDVINVRKGDKIFYAKHSGTDIELDRKYLLLDIGDVLLVM